MSGEINIPPLVGQGADAHEIRRHIEIAYRALDSARLRARRSGFGFVDGEITICLRSLEQTRKAVERLRREHTPPEFRRVGELQPAAFDAAHPEGGA